MSGEARVSDTDDADVSDGPPAGFETAMAEVVTAYELQHPRFVEAVGVTAAQLEALFYLRTVRQETPATLAAELRLTSSSVTYLLDQLERRNLASRRRHPTDRRSLMVSITEAGLAITDRFIELVAVAWRPAALDSDRHSEAAVEMFSAVAGRLSEKPARGRS